MTNHVRWRALFLAVAAGVCTLLVAGVACRQNETKDAQTNVGSSSSPTTVGNPASADPTKFDSEIQSLEKQAEKNPGNAEIMSGLARAYVRRGNARRDAGLLREALLDYQRAQRNDPDNEEATRNAADIASQVEGSPTGEYGEPAPLPITPNVTGDDEKPRPSPTKKP